MCEPWSCMKDTFLPWFAASRRLTANCLTADDENPETMSYIVLFCWCLVDVWAASNFNPEYFTRHLLWQMNPLCSFQKKAWKCGRLSSWTYADSTSSMYIMFFYDLYCFCSNLSFIQQMNAGHTHSYSWPPSFEKGHYFSQIIILDQDVWFFSANIVFEEILHSQNSLRVLRIFRINNT